MYGDLLSDLSYVIKNDMFSSKTASALVERFGGAGSPMPRPRHSESRPLF